MFTKVSRAVRKAKSHLYRNLVKPVKNYHGIIVHQRLTERNGIAERTVRRIKEGTSAVLFCNLAWTESGGRIPWNVTVLSAKYSRPPVRWEDIM